MTGLAWSLVWLAAMLAVVGWYAPAMVLALGMLAWSLRNPGCLGEHRLQSSMRWRRGRWLQSRWRCIDCGERVGWAR